MENNVKVLTLWQPWATLHAAGIKRNETRPGATSHKGVYLIHAAQKFPKEARELCATEPFKTELKKLGFDSWRDLPTGALLGMVEYTECQPILHGNIVGANSFLKRSVFMEENPVEFAFGDYSNERFVWIGTEHRAFKTPIPYTNGQGYYLPFKVDKIQDKANSFALIDSVGGVLRKETRKQIDEIFEMVYATNPTLQKAMDSNQKAIIIGHPDITEYQLSARLLDGEQIVIFPDENAEVPPKTIGVKLQELQEEMNIIIQTRQPSPKLNIPEEMLGFGRVITIENRKKEKHRKNRFSQRKFKSLTNGK